MAANASLISHTAMSETASPARASTLRIAGTGATENRCGSTATVALATTRPSTAQPEVGRCPARSRPARRSRRR